MTIPEWLAQFPRPARVPERRRLAAVLGVSLEEVYHYGSGQRNVPAKKCQLLVKATTGGWQHYYPNPKTGKCGRKKRAAPRLELHDLLPDVFQKAA